MDTLISAYEELMLNLASGLPMENLTEYEKQLIKENEMGYEINIPSGTIIEIYKDEREKEKNSSPIKVTLLYDLQAKVKRIESWRIKSCNSET